MHSPSESGRAGESGAVLLVSAARRRAVASNAAMNKQLFSINVGEFSRLQPVRSTILRTLLHGVCLRAGASTERVRLLVFGSKRELTERRIVGRATQCEEKAGASRILLHRT